MTSPATHNSPFLSLPGELRENIYEFVFLDPATNAPPMDSLTQKVPHSSGLRCVSKLLLADAARIYENAAKVYEAKRKEMVEGLVKYYEENSGEMVSKIGPWRVGEVLEVREGSKHCRHECAKGKQEGEVGCWMCNDLAHRACFECGRNLLIPLFCEAPTFRFPAPALIVPGTAAQQKTILGHSITSTPRRTVERIRPERSVPMPHPSWAWDWWVKISARQKAIDLQCHVRFEAIDKFYSISKERRPTFTEAMIRTLEKSQDRRAEYVGRIQNAERVVAKGRLKWEGQFMMLAGWRATRERVPVEVFIPQGFGQMI